MNIKLAFRCEPHISGKDVHCIPCRFLSSRPEPFKAKTVFNSNLRKKNERFYCAIHTILSKYKAVLLPVLHYTLADSEPDVND